jgi:hypothetical protein
MEPVFVGSLVFALLVLAARVHRGRSRDSEPAPLRRLGVAVGLTLVLVAMLAGCVRQPGALPPFRDPGVPNPGCPSGPPAGGVTYMVPCPS